MTVVVSEILTPVEKYGLRMTAVVSEILTASEYEDSG